MKVTITFDNGLSETTESFAVVYRNQFGSVLFAAQEYDDLFDGCERLFDVMTEELPAPTAGMFDGEDY